MLKFDISITQWLVIALANFILGWAWYSPLLFAKPWAKALKIKMGAKMTEAQKKEMPMLFAGAIISSLAGSFVLQVLVHSLGAVDFAGGALIGGLVFLGASLPASLGTLWEKRPKIVIAINLGNALLTFAVFGGVLAIWH